MLKLRLSNTTKDSRFKNQRTLYQGATTHCSLYRWAESYVHEKGVDVAKSFLEKYFPTVELQETDGQ